MLSCIRLEYTQHGVEITFLTALDLWNSLPNHIVAASSVGAFKRKLQNLTLPHSLLRKFIFFNSIFFWFYRCYFHALLCNCLGCLCFTNKWLIDWLIRINYAQEAVQYVSEPRPASTVEQQNAKQWKNKRQNQNRKRTNERYPDKKSALVHFRTLLTLGLELRLWLVRVRIRVRVRLGLDLGLGWG